MSYLASNSLAVLSNDEFNKFSKLLIKLSYWCRDLDIIDGKICQRINNKTAIIKCDLSHIIKCKDKFIFSDIWEIKEILKSIKMKSSINFTVEDSMLKITDNFTTINILSGDNIFASNEFIPDEELAEHLSIGTPLLSAKLDNDVCSALFKACKANNTKAIMMQLKSNILKLLAERRKNSTITQSYTIDYKLLFDTDYAELYIPSIVFSFATDRAVILEIYMDKDQNKTLNVAKFPISKNIFFEVYTKSILHLLENDSNQLHAEGNDDHATD